MKTIQSVTMSPAARRVTPRQAEYAPVSVECHMACGYTGYVMSGIFTTLGDRVITQAYKDNGHSVV